MKTLIFVSLAILLNLTPLQAQVRLSQVNTYPSRASIENLRSLVRTDGKGNYFTCFVSENANTERDITVMKYSENGTPVWVVNYDGNGRGPNEPRGMVIDANDNVYVTGMSFLKEGRFECLTFKISRIGKIEWENHYESVSGNSFGNSIAIDGSNFVYVAGSSGNSSFNDILLLKLDAQGNRVWARTFDGTDGLNDNAYSISLFKNNIYLCGDTRLLSEDYNFITLKYEDTGELIWFKTLSGTANSWDMGRSICNDKSGNVLVTGYLENIDTKQDYVTVKYDAAGNLIWRSDFNGSANGYDWSNHIKVDRNGNAFICGGSQNLTSPNPECFSELGKCQNDATLIKYKPNGKVDWINIYNGPDNYYDCLQGIDLDQAGNVYVAGRSHYDENTNQDDIITFKYSNDGERLWFMRYGVGVSAEYGNDIAADNSGNVFVVGSKQNNGLYDMISLKYTPENILSTDNLSTKVSSSAYPNPFNPTTKIKFDVPSDGFVTIKIFDATGKMIEQLLDKNVSKGSYEQEWNASDYSSGIYFYKLETGSFSEVKRMILLK